MDTSAHPYDEPVRDPSGVRGFGSADSVFIVSHWCELATVLMSYHTIPGNFSSSEKWFIVVLRLEGRRLFPGVYYIFQGT
jgi:hypothetical protein